MVWGESWAPVAKHVHAPQLIIGVRHGRAQPHLGIWAQRRSKPVQLDLRILRVSYLARCSFCLCLHYQDRAGPIFKHLPPHLVKGSDLLPGPILWVRASLTDKHGQGQQGDLEV